MPPKNKYTDPSLRDKVKQEIQDSDKGGAPGQWSARKAQFMAAEYKKRGGGYEQDKESGGQDESGRSLEKWTEEEWQTKDGSGNAKKADGTQKRYLPKKAWEQMSEKEKEATDAKKQKESSKGKQFVGNTGQAKDARKKAVNGKGAKKGKEEEEDEAEREDGEDEKDESVDEEDEDNDDEEEEEEETKPNQRTTKKRTRSSAPSTSTSSTNKKQKTHGSKHDTTSPPAPQGSNDRLPKKGQSISWKALPGWVHGTVVEVVKSGKTVRGKKVKASQEEPRIVLESQSGKVCVHKCDACYFD